MVIPVTDKFAAPVFWIVNVLLTVLLLHSATFPKSVLLAAFGLLLPFAIVTPFPCRFISGSVGQLKPLSLIVQPFAVVSVFLAATAVQ